MALLFRSAEGVLGAATALLSLMVLSALSHGQGADAVGMLLEARTAALDIVLVFVGVGGAAFCYLLLVSRVMPRFLAAWGVATYVSMFALALLSVLWPEHPLWIETTLYAAGTTFEVSIGLWLVVKAIDGQRWMTHAHPNG